MASAQLEQLAKHGSYLSVPRGTSMWPLIRNGTDIVEVQRIREPARRYDIVMYVRQNGQGVIHRVIHVRREDYLILGDNCWRKEYVAHDMVRGVVTRIYRNGTWHRVDEVWCRIYAHVWVDLLFVRRPLLYVRDKLKHVFCVTHG